MTSRKFSAKCALHHAQVPSISAQPFPFPDQSLPGAASCCRIGESPSHSSCHVTIPGVVSLCTKSSFLITFRFFVPLGKSYILAKLKLTSPNVRETDFTPIYLLIGMRFCSCTCHSWNVAHCQNSDTILLIWRTKCKTYDIETSRSMELT